MHTYSIASVISFCTHDFRFLRQCLKGVVPFSEQILVTVCDHFFNGEQENYALLEEAYRAFPEVTFLEFRFHTTERYGDFCTLEPRLGEERHHWHNVGRFTSYYFLQEKISHLFFFDVDELAEGERLREWLLQDGVMDHNALRFAAHVYFREAHHRKETFGNGPLLVRRVAVQPEMLLDPDERSGLFWAVSGEKREDVQDQEGFPFVHHYSFVRPKEEMLCKVQRWGHFWERDWEGLIEEEFRHEFNGVDFVLGHRHTPALPFFDPLAEKIPDVREEISLEEHRKRCLSLSNVISVTPRDLFRKDIALRLSS